MIIPRDIVENDDISLEDLRDMGYAPDEDKYRIKNDLSVATLDLYEQLVYMGMI